MSKVLIIGYGNPLRGDDGVGWEAGERLEAVIPVEVGEVMVCHQLTPELAEEVSRAERVIFIDAREGGAAGEVRRVEIEAGPSGWGAFVHHMDAASLLACAKELYGKCGKGTMLTVTAESFEYGEGLSASVRKGLEEVVEWVKGEVGGGQ